MRKLTLLTSVLLTAPFAAGNVSAQCMNTINCQTLGYTKTSCTKGGVKCPTGNYWYCPKDTTTPQCDSSYKYTCTGAYQSPSGTACNGLYTSCTCASGYQWTNGSCQKKEIAWGTCTGLVQNCSIGNILNSDGTCSTNKISGKTPIGVVVYKSGNCGQAIALEDLGRDVWSRNSNKIPNLIYYQSNGLNDFDSCGNTQKIVAMQFSQTYYPAAYQASKYSTVGTKAGDWCLPAYGVLYSYAKNKTAVKAGLNKVGSSIFSLRVWSSTAASETFSYGMDLKTSSSSQASTANDFSIVPVLQF